MEDFIVNNYVWIVIVCLFIIFTLIGYMADKSSKAKKEKKTVKPASIQNQNTNIETNKEAETVSKVSDDKNEQVLNTEIENNTQTETPKQENVTPQENNQNLTLDELIAKNSNDTSYVKLPEENNETSNNVDNTETISNENEKVSEEIKKDEEVKPEVKTVHNSWEPELEEENKDIITENKEPLK